MTRTIKIEKNNFYSYFMHPFSFNIQYVNNFVKILFH